MCIYDSNKMTRSKQAMASECCMCGDPGFPLQLFQCRVCQFRSQHSYCSNVYTKAEANQVCNWCLSQDDTREKSQNSSNSSSSHKNSSTEDRKIKRKSGEKLETNNHGNLKTQMGTLQQKALIKKQGSPERSSSIRKRIITNGRLEEKLRRIKSAESLTRTKSEISHKQVIRNKVRRYKLLDEVSS